MDLDRLDLNPRITAAVKKAKLKSIKEVLHFSGPDLQRLTGLSSLDVQRLLRTASLHLGPGVHCLAQGSQGVTPGCSGHSSPGSQEQPRKENLGIWEACSGRASEGNPRACADQPPCGEAAGGGGLTAPRGVIAGQRHLRPDVPGEVIDKMKFGHQIFVEHVADVDALLECVSKKVPVLLSRGMVRLVVIDSVAAPFRCEFDSLASMPRARRLQALGATLRRLSSTFRSPVLCINQFLSVTVGPVFCLSLWEERVSPALGMTWSNQLLMRLMVSRRRPEEEAVLPPPGRPDRTLRVIFAPHLPPSSCSYTVSTEGVRGTPGTEAI
uniref:DNA repair protein n=1 Tax=Panthera tigris altaica TaxID=74533 RepID=A0A8C9L2H0_PANTA